MRRENKKAQHSGEIVKAAMKSRGLTQSEFARLIGKDQSLISRYLAGQIEISLDTAYSIAEVLEIDFEDLRRQLQRDKLDRRTERLKIGFKGILDESASETAHVGSVSTKEYLDIIAVPLWDSFPAGFPNQPEEEAESYVIPLYLQVDPAKTFALKVSGENMTDDKVDEGDIIVVDAGAAVRDDDRVLVIVGGEPAIKRIYHKGGTVVFQSSGSHKEPLILLSQQDDFKVIGRVVMCTKRFV